MSTTAAAAAICETVFSSLAFNYNIQMRQPTRREIEIEIEREIESHVSHSEIGIRNGATALHCLGTPTQHCRLVRSLVLHIFDEKAKEFSTGVVVVYVTQPSSMHCILTPHKPPTLHAPEIHCKLPNALSFNGNFTRNTHPHTHTLFTSCTFSIDSNYILLSSLSTQHSLQLL